MIGTASEFTKQHPGVSIEWEARSLHDFGEAPLGELVKRYDLLVIDHPFMGTVARHGWMVPIDAHLASEILETLRSESVGRSHGSYYFDGHQWAFAIDAATQVSAYRPDLMEKLNSPVPRTWDQVLELGRMRPGIVSIPLYPVDALMSFFTLCANSGEAPFSSSTEKVVTEDTGAFALERLRSLREVCSPDCLKWNPPAVWERMSSSDDIAYCPLGYGYSNYARPGYRRAVIFFTDIPSKKGLGPIGSTLGGAGLAISARCGDILAALKYASWVASAECQRTVYFESGGQPGNRRAWEDPAVNRASNDFFKSTLRTIENAFVRPRFDGYVEFQTGASEAVHHYLRGDRDIRSTLLRLNELYQHPHYLQPEPRL